MAGFSPKHTKADRDLVNFNGLIIPNLGVYVASGSIEDISGGLTGSAEFQFDAAGVRLLRIEVFHSGSASNFNLALENSKPNTGSFFDPRNLIVYYDQIPGSTNYTGGLDQIESIVALTDKSPTSEGKLYLKFMPYGEGNNSFKYIVFFEAVILYVGRDPINTRIR